MPDLTVQLSESLFKKLDTYATNQRKTPQEIVIESLEANLTDDAGSMTQRERMQQFLRTSSLFSSEDQKLGPELETLLQPISQAERERLAQALSKGKSLSEIIIEDRGE